MKKVLTILLAITLVFTLAGCKEEVDTVDADNVADATTKLSLNVSDSLAVTSNIELQLAGLHDAVISWSSSDTSVVANDGTVTRPAIDAGDASVVLTATVTIGDETLTKEFTIKVLEAVPTSAVTIAVFNSDTTAVGDTVEITGIVTGTIVGKGFHIYDGTGHTYVYEGIECVYAIGDELTVSGEKKIYYNITEVVEVTSITVVSTGNALPAFEETTIADIYLEDNEDTDIYNTMISFTGVVELRGQYNSVYINWLDSNFEKVGIEVYYKSGSSAKIDEIAALEGKMISVDAILMDYYSQGWWRISVNTSGAVTELAMTDLHKAEYAAAMLDLGDLTSVDVDLDLPLVGENDATIAWASDTEAVIAVNGEITGAVAETDVVLTATITVGAESVVKTFDAHVLDVTAIPVSVAEVLALADDAVVTVVGVVTGFNYAEPMIQDADGAAIYISSDIIAEVGDKVVITGTLGTYDSYGNDRRELYNATLVEIKSSDNALFVHDTYTVDEVYGLYPATQSLRIMLTNAVIDVMDDGYGYTFIVSGDQNIKFKAPVYFDTLFAEGDAIPEITFNVVEVSYSNLKVVELYFGGLTDVQKLIAATMSLKVADTVVEDIVLPTEFPEFDATITWTTTNSTAINKDGHVVRPAMGAGDVVVILGAEVTVGPLVDTVIFVTTVPEKPTPAAELFFSEYIEGSGNNKAIEIYNPFPFAVDLSDYTVVENYGSGTNELELSGMLASGDVYVLCADAAEGATLVAECDELLAYPSVAHFNGDDTLQLLKGTKVIDRIGAETGTNYAKDVTLVRNAEFIQGNDVWTIAEWTEYATDTFDYIGSHDSASPVAAVPGLFFSEYGEPDGGLCKYVEIYNPTDATIDLTGWTISSPDEGDLFSTDYRVDVLTGSILSGETIVIGAADCFDGSDSGSIDGGFPQTGLTYIISSGNATAFFNGDDSLGLFNGDVLVDVIGFDGSVKDTMFSVGTGDDDTKNVVLVRMPSVVAGELDWDIAMMTWIVKDDRDYTDVGTHTTD